MLLKKKYYQLNVIEEPKAKVFMQNCSFSE